MRLSPLPVGHASCAEGGVLVEVGVDDGEGDGAPNDGILDDDEVDQSSPICNGADGEDGADGQNGENGQNGTNGQDGSSSLITLEQLPAGAICVNGGVKVLVGADDGAGAGTPGDGVLHVDEIDWSEVICAGIDG
jgi:hypothetical protein